MPELAWMEQVVPDQFDNDIIPFWEGLKQHEFKLYRCGKCGRHYWPMTLCPEHADATFADMAWTPTSGRGQIFSWSIVHRVNNPLWTDEVPYALVLVELDEGPIFPTRLIGHAPADIGIGQRVEVEYQDVQATGMTLPLFRIVAPD